MQITGSQGRQTIAYSYRLLRQLNTPIYRSGRKATAWVGHHKPQPPSQLKGLQSLTSTGRQRCPWLPLHAGTEAVSQKKRHVATDLSGNRRELGVIRVDSAKRSHGLDRRGRIAARPPHPRTGRNPFADNDIKSTADSKC